MTDAQHQPNEANEPSEAGAGAEAEGTGSPEGANSRGVAGAADPAAGDEAGHDAHDASNQTGQGDTIPPDLSGLDQLLGDDFARISEERDEYLATLQRLQADFDNYRKRAMRQQTELLDQAGQRVLTQLLPVLDAFDLALAHVEPDAAEGQGPPTNNNDTKNGDDAAASLAQIASLLNSTLEREGLSRIDQVDVPFDPAVHEAVAHEPREEGTEGPPSVSEVMRSGYQLKGRVIRPAMVKVRG